MATDTPLEGLKPKDFTEQRNDALREGVKGLLLINGGGATAMLAFLQAVWATKPQIVPFVVGCIAFLSFGLFLAGLVQFFRYQASFAWQGGRTVAFRRYRFLYLAAAYTSLGAFIVGIGVLVVGVLCSTVT
jgi:hypothetical protein